MHDTIVKTLNDPSEFPCIRDRIAQPVPRDDFELMDYLNEKVERSIIENGETGK